MKRGRNIVAFLLFLVSMVSTAGCESVITENACLSEEHVEASDVPASEKKYESSKQNKSIEEMMREIEKKRLPSSVALDVEPIYQEPELPTGCEAVSLTMLLAYEGFDLEKMTIAEEYLVYSKNWDLDEGYVGNPTTYEGAGCFPPTIVQTAKKYLTAQKSSLEAVDLTGKSMEELLHYVADGHPVAVWTSMYMEAPILTEQEESTFPWYDTEHCVVLSGYDLEEDILIVQDPLMGTIDRKQKEFTEIYDLIGRYAVVLL